MAIVIVATPGSATANSYVTEAEAIAYAATRLNLSGWTTVAGSTATENEKKALIEATRELDMLTFRGRRIDSAQYLKWPRAYAAMEEDEPLDTILTSYNLDLYYSGVPQRLKDATIELAFEFLRAGEVDIAAAPESAGVIREKIDVIETEWSAGSGAQDLVGLARFPRVVNLIAPLLVTRTNEVYRS